MNTNYPFWFQVLKSFYENDDYYNGLTIPYLVGASTIISLDKPLITINDLITEAQNMNLPHMVELLFCEAEEEFVLRIYDKENLVGLDEFHKQYDNLIITEESLAYLSLEEVINDMYMLYQEHIQKGNYHKNNGKWSNYSKYDINRIIPFNS
ncbi:hypothetical protein AXE80_08190 [Wenyingzhuangia fucanilytica]|uniref:Uncharacterized protein n=1 Tax=Wenyingzhuangia fucanilytica TaxID=1790137 RepID=A0A1B1Y669_9FLAO|nr:hypothetical protein [Wenyingzhuangia fucanilytica]ANW96260.1 hypothetical protein AXE80_08190 [Wenyingzhuangia fucanilytica]